MMTAPIFKEGMRRASRQKALNANIMAARILSEAMKTSLGPKGMDKMFLTSVGDVFVTNDGATILEKMDVTNPIAKMLVEVAKTQDEMAGDGTTTSVVLAGELLKEAKDLIGKNIHPSIIMGGYEIATKRSLEFMKDFAFKINPNDYFNNSYYMSRDEPLTLLEWECWIKDFEESIDFEDFIKPPSDT